MSNLSAVFEARIRSALLECHRLGYHPTDFERMLDATDAVSLAKKLVASGELQSGLRRLHSLGRLDLSLEKIMLEPEFAPLFLSQELSAADWRLKQLKP